MGRKREKRKYEAAQEKAAGTELRRILLEMKITVGAKKRTGEERKPRGTTLFAGAGCAGRPNVVGISHIIQEMLPTINAEIQNLNQKNRGNSKF